MARHSLLALALLVGVLWWWVRGSGMPEPMPMPTGTVASSASLDTVAAKDERTAAPARPDVGRSAAEIPAVGRPTRFVVRDADSLAVVPGAAIHYFPPRTTAQRIADEDRLEREDREVVLREAGRSAIADDQGRVDVVVDPGQDVSARLDDRYGELSLDGEEVPGVPRTIWLQRDVNLVVEVVDAVGQPCPGVRVDVVARGTSRRHGEVAFDDVSQPTDATGRVAWHHLQRHGITSSRDLIEAHIELHCSAEHLAAVRRSLHIDDLVRPVRLVVPAGGTVQMRMLDADGEPLIHAYGSLRDGSDVLLHPSNGERERLVFAQVPLGRTWRMVARVGETSVEQELVGPARGGEVVAAEIVVPVRRWQVRGRIVWQGQPQPGMTVQFEGAPGAFAAERKAVATDAAGVFAMRGHAPSSATPWTIALGVTTQYAVERSLTSTRELQAGEVDLGDLEVSPGCATGPLAVVRLLADGHDVSTTGWAQIHAEKKVPGAKKRRLRLVRTVSRVGPGGIALHGPAVEGPLSLSVGAPGWRAVSRSIEPGASLTVELEVAASLRASVLLPCGACELRLVREQLASGHGLGPSAEQWPWYDFIGVQPGRWCLEVDAADVVVHRTPAFELVAGPNVWPRDGSTLDLRHVAHFVHASLVDAATGRAIEDRNWLRVPESGGEPQAVEGAPWFRPVVGQGDLLIVAEGYVPLRVPAPEADVRLAMQPLTKVHGKASAVTERVVVRVIEDGVRDAVVREVDPNSHETEYEFDAEQDIELAFAPGTLLDVVTMSGGVAAPARRIVVGTASPQVIELP